MSGGCQIRRDVPCAAMTRPPGGAVDVA